MKNSAELERCADFLARMIEKYGNEIDFPKEEEHLRKENSNKCEYGRCAA